MSSDGQGNSTAFIKHALSDWGDTGNKLVFTASYLGVNQIPERRAD
jgi:hypothetical protein